jgi:hypothetical protein
MNFGRTVDLGVWVEYRLRLCEFNETGVFFYELTMYLR